MSDAGVAIRPYEAADREGAMALAHRLEIGVAQWRDAGAVREAVAGWVRASLDGHAGEGRAVLVAVDGGEVGDAGEHARTRVLDGWFARQGRFPRTA